MPDEKEDPSSIEELDAMRSLVDDIRKRQRPVNHKILLPIVCDNEADLLDDAESERQIIVDDETSIDQYRKTLKKCAKKARKGCKHMSLVGDKHKMFKSAVRLNNLICKVE